MCKYSEQTPNVYVATGFNKWGMTSSMVSAMIISDMILDKENDFSEKIVKHARDTFGGIDVLINNAGLSHRCTVDEMTEDLFDQILILGPTRCQ